MADSVVPFFASVVDGQLLGDALFRLEGVPVHLRLLQRAHLGLLAPDPVQDARHACRALGTANTSSIHIISVDEYDRGGALD